VRAAAAEHIIHDTIEVEMWRPIHSGQIEQSFWFETGVDWLVAKQWQGNVLVCFDGRHQDQST
jgi:hypothetical protein